MRTRTPQPGRRSLTDAERTHLLALLDAIPVGADCHDECMRAFVGEWYRLHLRPYRGRYSIYLMRSTPSVSAELLGGLSGR